MQMIDRIWYAAEKWRQKVGNHLTGDLLLQTISLWVLVPIVGLSSDTRVNPTNDTRNDPFFVIKK